MPHLRLELDELQTPAIKLDDVLRLSRRLCFVRLGSFLDARRMLPLQHVVSWVSLLSQRSVPCSSCTARRNLPHRGCRRARSPPELAISVTRYDCVAYMLTNRLKLTQFGWISLHDVHWTLNVK